MQPTLVSTLVSAAAVVAAGTGIARAGPLDQPDAAELTTYSSLYWQYKDTGTPGQDAAAFRFSDPAFNSPLFSPVRAAMRKVQAAKGISVDMAESCWGAVGSISIADIKMFMVESKIETPVDHTAEVAAHLAKLLEALGEGQNVAFSIEDDKLVTVGLDPATATIVPIDTAPVPADAEVAALMSTVATAAQQLTAAQDLSAGVSGPLTGATPYWYSFLVGLELSLGQAGANVGAHVSSVEAAFGQYGSLVLARVDTERGVYLLVDTVNGAVAGPYPFSQPYDARALLATHTEYSAGDTIMYVGKGGCATVYPVADTKTPVPGTTFPPPGGWVPLTPTPTYPTLGRPDYWVCRLVGVACECESTYRYEVPAGTPCPVFTPPMVPGAPCLIFQTVTCTGGTPAAPCGAAGCPDGLPNTIWPPPPPPLGGPIAPGCAIGCSSFWWYWS